MGWLALIFPVAVIALAGALWLCRVKPEKPTGPDALAPKDRERLERDFGIEMASLLERRESPFNRFRAGRDE